MNKQKVNKEFVLRYFEAISGKTKTAAICDEFMDDEELKEHILFFDTIFPEYELFADEMVAEADQITIRARMKGIHKGIFNGIPPTYRKVEMPFAINYKIRNGKIVEHWLIADQVVLMQQLGVIEPET